MLERIRTYLQFGNNYCGIEHTNIDGNLIITATILKKQNKEIVIDGEYVAVSIENQAKNIHPKQNASLVINNEKVIAKLIESDQVNGLKLVLKAFPNINIEEFYFEVLSQKSKHFISLCRKQVVHDIIEEYKSHGISIVHFSLGNILAASVNQFITSSHISTSNAQLQFENNTLNSIQSKTEINPILYNVNGLDTGSQYLLSLASALESIIHQHSSLTNFEDKVGTLQSEYEQARIFKLGLKFSGFIFLFILLINFLIFNHYYNQVAILEQKVQTNQSTLDQMTQLSGKVANAQRMVEEIFQMSHSKSSFFIDAIVRTQPNSILLEKLNYQPLKKKIKSGKPIELDDDVIVISGESTSSDSFSKWLANMESLSWIAQIHIVDYRDISSSKSAFQIKIEMDEN